MPSITLSMIVKNEERFLRGCLESANGIADEIVIVDSGSTDKTLDIAREFKAKIFPFDWINDFSAARNFALQKSTGDWILYLDADERLAEKSFDAIRRIVQSRENLGVKCSVRSENKTGGTPSQMLYVRFFKNHPQARFTGRVHEQIEPALEALGYKLIEEEIEIIHLGYDRDEEILRQKAERNLKLLFEDYKENPTGYNAFQIGQSHIFLNDFPTAVKYFEIALRDENLEKSHQAHAYRYLAADKLEKKEIAKAEEYVNKGLSLLPEAPLLNIVAANISIEEKKFKAAADYCRKAYEYNSLLLTGRKSAHFDISLEEKNILLYGINAAIIIGDKTLFKFFDEKLSRVSIDGENGKIISLYRQIFNDDEISDFDFPSSKIDVMVLLRALNGYSHIDSKIKAL
ncbi:MAG: glycosyltransferase family 2 protein, partial [Chlorobi bacterium]|nr:glycosyltransferase family 2 protein [Chlorobiota bacterium]